MTACRFSYGGLRAESQGRRSRVHGQAGGSLARREAARRQHAQAERGHHVSVAVLQPYLPPGMHADKIGFAQSKFIETSISYFSSTLSSRPPSSSRSFSSSFLLNFRTTMVSLAAIPVSRPCWCSRPSASSTRWHVGGLAMATGELVDDAVVGVENIYRRLRLNRQLAVPRSARSALSPMRQSR